jgi:transposase
MGYFSTRQTFFLYSYTSEVEEYFKLDQYLQFLEDSGVGEILKSVKTNNRPQGGRPEYNRYDMFATILFGFAFTSGSLRDIESSCKYDIRFMTLMRGKKPHFTIIGNYINDYIVPHAEEIFGAVTRQLIKVLNLELEDIFIDGTKIEADANKYKFVWKPTTFHIKLCDKVRALLELHNLQTNVPTEGIFQSIIIARKLSEFSQLIHSKDVSERKALMKQYNQLKGYLEKALEYEEMEMICGPDRNSYYKTDHDATAMTLKTDYYSGLGSNMHAAYNVQVAICKGIACAYYVSQKRNDITELIPTIEQFYRIHNRYPKNLCADAGYGSLNSYRYMKEHNIGNYVKHQSWEGNVSGKNPNPYRLNDDNTITCLNGKTGKITELENRHPKNKESVFYKVVGCKSCSFRKYCKRWQKRKSENFKIFEVNVELRKYIQEAENNLLSVKGIEIRVNRSCQVEGSYGVLKQDMRYNRFRRISLPKVTAEYMLTFLGYNVRKLFRYFNENLKTTYWKAPEDLQPETFKKPSAKRLSNKMEKKKKKSANQQAKTSYKYKKKG